MDEPLLLIHDARDLARAAGTSDGRWLLFSRPRAVHLAREVAQIRPMLETVERAVAQGAWAAGYLAYESAPAFDPALAAHPPRTGFPLAWWGLFDPPQVFPGEDLPPREALPIAATASCSERLDWRPSVDRETFRRQIETIHRHIARGETYQVNYTFPLETAFRGHPYPLFERLLASQRGARYGAYLELGNHALCSVSPELFVARRGRRLLCRPMKGTARRGRFPREDEALAQELRESPKEQAENVMIVDMLRNDLGRIAEPGSVRVEALYTVETYPTVHQLTSTIRAESDRSFVELMTALFPCASITGAPKVATSHLIRRLENEARGVYTGSIGFLSPERLQLNVAIRTAVVDRTEQRATYGVGSGVVWDSRADAEYDECRAKARILAEPAADFELFETLLWRPRSGYFLLRRHLDRLAASARYFAFRYDAEATERALAQAVAGAEERSRVRLVLARDGRSRAQRAAFPCDGRRVWRLALDDRPVSSHDPLLFHKTTRRNRYDEALERARERYGNAAGAPDEVLLWNEEGELTEGCRTNLVLELDGRRLTPRLEAGLLPGTYRAALLERGRLEEARLVFEDLRRASRIFLVNGLRGWIRGRWVESEIDSAMISRLRGTISPRTSIQSGVPGARGSTSAH